MKYVEDPVSEFIITDRVLNRKKSSPGLRQLKVSLDKESTKVTLKTKENILAFD